MQDRAGQLDLAATLNPQERKRGLFSATVYDATVDMQGAFVVPAEARLRDFVADKDGASSGTKHRSHSAPVAA